MSSSTSASDVYVTKNARVSTIKSASGVISPVDASARTQEAEEPLSKAHCSALNQPKQHGERVSELDSLRMSSSTSGSDAYVAENARVSTIESASGIISPVDASARARQAKELLSEGMG